MLNIKVEYEEAIKGIAEYRMKIDELKKSEEELSKQKKAGVLSEEEYQRALAANKIQMKEYNDSIRVLEKEIRNNIKAQTEQEDSLKSLRAKLSNLTAEYDSLSKSERNASKGQGIQKKINDITNELKEAEEATQRYYRNVGNYENSIKDVLSVTNNGFTKGIQNVMGFSKQLKALIAIPVVAVLSAIAVAVTAISNGISGSEENTNRWRKAMAPFKVVLDGVENLLTAFASKILTVVEYGGKFLQWTTKMIGKIPFLSGAMETVNEKIAERVRLEEMQIANEQAARKEIEESAKMENEIAQLRAKVTDRENYTAKERKAALEEAIRLEKESAEIKRKLAADQLAALELEGSLTENDAEMNDRLAEARANVTRAETEYFNKVREMNAQRTELNNQIATEEKKRLEEELLNNKRREQALQESAIVFENILTEEGEMAKELLNPIGMEQLKADLDARVEAERAAAEERVRIAEKEAEAKLQMQDAVATGIEALEELGGDYARVAKVLALAQIAIDTGKALSAGIAQAAAAGPFPANIGAIATTVATVLANIAAAKKAVQGAKFATGGLVTGSGSGTSDSIPARLSNGESVMTARATEMFSPLLSSLNQMGGGVPISLAGQGSSIGEDMLAMAVAKGMAMAPSPVVSVEEIQRVQKRVAVLEQLGSI